MSKAVSIIIGGFREQVLWSLKPSLSDRASNALWHSLWPTCVTGMGIQPGWEDADRAYAGLFIFFVSWLCLDLLSSRNLYYVITSLRIVRRSGYLKATQREMMIAAIKEVKVDKPAWGGHEVTFTGLDGSVLVFDYVRKLQAEQAAKLVETLRKAVC